MSHEARSSAPEPTSDRVRDEVWARNLLDDSDECIYFKDLQSRFIRVSAGCAALHGRTPEQMIGLSDFDLFDDAHAMPAYADEQRVIATGEALVNKEERERWCDKPDTWVASSKFPLRDVDGAIVGTFGISRDITQRVLVEHEMARVAQESASTHAELSRVEAQLRSVLEHSSDAIAQYDRDLRYRYINPAGERLRGMARADLVGLTDRQAGLDAEPVEAWEAALRRVLESQAPGELEFSTTGADGHEGWFHTTLAPETDAKGAVVGVLTSTRDVTVTKSAERALAHQALHDPVTGLANRYLLMDRLSRTLLRLERSGGRVALYFIDIDHFKAVNDTYGHEVGDQVLVEVAGRLSAVGRKQDTVSRLGGDEFVVLCEGVSSDADVREIAARLVAALAVPFDDGAVVARLSASIGAAVATHPEVRGRDLLRQADAAMYRVKQNGRNGFAVAGDR